MVENKASKVFSLKCCFISDIDRIQNTPPHAHHRSSPCHEMKVLTILLFWRVIQMVVESHVYRASCPSEFPRRVFFPGFEPAAPLALPFLQPFQAVTYWCAYWKCKVLSPYAEVSILGICLSGPIDEGFSIVCYKLGAYPSIQYAEINQEVDQLLPPDVRLAGDSVVWSQLVTSVYAAHVLLIIYLVVWVQALHAELIAGHHPSWNVSAQDIICWFLSVGLVSIKNGKYARVSP